MSLNIYLMKTQRVSVCSENTTHNHGKMADALGVYTHLWHPEELGLKYAHELIAPLRGAINELETNPEKYRQYDAPNGWGKVEYFIIFLKKVLSGCEETPEAEIEVSV